MTSKKYPDLEQVPEPAPEVLAAMKAYEALAAAKAAPEVLYRAALAWELAAKKAWDRDCDEAGMQRGNIRGQNSLYHSWAWDKAKAAHDQLMRELHQELAGPAGCPIVEYTA